MGFSGSRVFSESFRMLKERFGPLLGLVVTFVVIQIAISLVFALVVGVGALAGLGSLNNPQLNMANTGAGMGAGMILAMIAFYIVYLLIAFAQYGSLSAMASPLQKPTFGDALGAGLRSSPTLLGVMLLAFIGYLVVAMGLGLLFGLLATVLGTAGSALSLFITLVVLIYMASRLVPIMPVIAVEGVRNPVTALKRAWSLTRGNVLKIVLVNAAFMIGAVLLIGLAFVPFFSTMQQIATSGAAPDFGSIALTFVLVMLIGVVVAMFASAFQAVIHAELAGHAGQDLAMAFE